MIKKLILTYTHNPKTGAILQPALTIKENKTSVYEIANITPETSLENVLSISEHIQTMLNTCFEYSEKNIFQIFGRRNESQTAFFENLDEQKLKKHIRPFIDKRIISVLQIAYAEKIPVYIKQAHHIFETDTLIITDSPLLCNFYFKYQGSKLEYSLQLQYKNDPVHLKGERVSILSEDPSSFILNQKIYFIEGFNTKKIIPFINKESIVVPERLVDEYMDKFVRNAFKSHNVSTDGIEVHEPDITPIPKLKLEQTINNQFALNLSFIYEDYNIRPDQSANKAIVSYNKENRSFLKIKRDATRENTIKTTLTELGLIRRTGTLYMLKNQLDDYALIEWLNTNAEELEKLNVITETHTEKNYFLKNIRLTFQTTEKNDWFDLYGLVRLGDMEIPFIKLKNHILRGIREFVLPDGSVAIIPEAWFADYKELFGLGTPAGKTLRFKKYQFEALRGIHADIAEQQTEKLKKLLTDQSHFALPDTIQAKLRSYQEKGYQWMRRLREYQFGGCLADDMGLGKTIQTLALLTYHHSVDTRTKTTTKKSTLHSSTQQLNLFGEEVYTPEKKATSLIISPASLVHNWENEVQKFAPALQFTKHTTYNRTQNPNNFKYYDLILSSYGIVRNDIEMLQSFCFDYIIIDESQHIKNPNSATYKAVSELQAKNKLVLTGTPVENSLTDLWAQLNFINPGIAGNKKWFKDYYVIPIEKQQNAERLQKLKKLTTPFILRRTKAEVATDLPPLTEQTIWCEMSTKQEEIYEERKSATRNALLKTLTKEQIRNNTPLILKALNELRQLANHPAMLLDNYTENAGKTDIVTRHLENLIAENHKVLIFSSFVRHLDIIQEVCQTFGWKYSLLTGKSRQREKIINEFQNDADNHLFLISLKAGGVGLNLTAADYVMVLDPWWNPAAEAQAINRAHRIGQHKNVFVYRYITRNSIEEKIRILQTKKQQLSDDLIEDQAALKNMSAEEIESLFT